MISGYDLVCGNTIFFIFMVRPNSLGEVTIKNIERGMDGEGREWARKCQRVIKRRVVARTRNYK
jgi:hypothetical protein